MINLVFAIITGTFCLFIALQLGKRSLKEDNDRLAWNAFRVWWFGLGLTTALGALRALIVSAGVDSLIVYVWYGLITTFILCAALWGLLYYLVYLYTGNRALAWPLAIFYIVFFIGLVIYSFFVLQPQSLSLENGTATVNYSVEPTTLYTLVLGLIVLAPQLIASLAYFSLYFRLRDRIQKYRVLLVSGSVFVWFSSPLVALGLSISDAAWWMWVSRVISLLAVLFIYWAYYPPQFIQRRFGVVSI